MVYAGVFGVEYKTTACIVCQKRRRGQLRPRWYVERVEDLPKIGEEISDWEQRKRGNPGVFT
jgi:hypothetical protein